MLVSSSSGAELLPREMPELIRGFRFFGRYGALLVVLLSLMPATFGQNAGESNRKQVSQAEAIYSKGVEALKNGDLKSAGAAFEEVIKVLPNSPDARNSLGFVLMTEGNYDDAIEQFRQALKYQPNFLQARTNLANTLLAKGDFAAAIREAHSAIALAPKDAEPHRILAHALDASGKNCRCHHGIEACHGAGPYTA